MIMSKISKISIHAAIVLLYLFVLVHTIGVAIQTHNIATGVWEPAVDWDNFGGLKMAIVGLRAVSLLVLVVLFTIFIFNSFRSETAPFARANNGLIMWSLVPYLIYAFCESNFGILAGERYIQLSSGTIIGGCLLLMVAIFYRRATLLAEENDLTI